MAASKRSTTTAKATAKPVAAPVVTTISRPSTCGKLFELTRDGKIAAEGCKRLPRHKGDHKAAKPRGLMTQRERAAATAARLTKAASKKVAPKGISRIVTVAGTKFRVTVGSNGEAVLTKVAAAKVAQVTQPAAPVTKPVAASKAAPKGRKGLSKAAAGRLAKAVEDGSIAPSAALSRVAASQRGRVNRPVRTA